MVRKIFKFITGEIRGLHQAAYLLGTLALASQIFALVRDKLLAHFFGAGTELDIYFAAFRIPDMIFVGVSSLSSLGALIPIVAAKMERDPDRASEFLHYILAAFFVAVIFFSAVAYLAMPLLARLFFVGFSEDAIVGSLVPLSRVMLFSPFFLGISGIFATVVQLHRKFFLYALSPILYNIGIILGILVFVPYFKLMGLGIGVVLGAFMHAIVQIPFILRAGFLRHIGDGFKLKKIFFSAVEVARLSFPRAAALSIHQLTLFAFTATASLLGTGSIAVFTLAYNLQSVPLSIVGISYSLAAFPTLSRLYARGEYKEYTSKIISSLRHLIFWSMPAAAFFIVLRAQIVRVIYGSGEFSWDATRLTAASLALFAFSVLAQSVTLLLIRGHYAAGKTRAPLFISLFGNLVIIFLGIVFLAIFDGSLTFRTFFESLMRVQNVSGAAILMLPLSYTLGQILMSSALYLKFKNDFAVESAGQFNDLGKTLGQGLFVALIIGSATFLALNIADNFINLSTTLGIFSQGMLAGLFGAFVGFLSLRALKNPELMEIEMAMKSIFKRA